MATMYMPAETGQRKNTRNMGHHPWRNKAGKTKTDRKSPKRSKANNARKQKRHLEEDALANQAAPTKRIKLKHNAGPTRARHTQHEHQKKRQKGLPMNRAERTTNNSTHTDLSGTPTTRKQLQ